MAVMLADGGQSISDPAVLHQQPAVFGPVASTPPAWRVLACTGEPQLAGLRAARAQARELAWMQATETGRAIPADCLASQHSHRMAHQLLPRVAHARRWRWSRNRSTSRPRVSA
jgi:hypothetical protein